MNVLANIKLISASALIFADDGSKYKAVFKTVNQTQTQMETHKTKIRTVNTLNTNTCTNTNTLYK